MTIISYFLALLIALAFALFGHTPMESFDFMLDVAVTINWMITIVVVAVYLTILIPVVYGTIRTAIQTGRSLADVAREQAAELRDRYMSRYAARLGGMGCGCFATMMLVAMSIWPVIRILIAIFAMHMAAGYDPTLGVVNEFQFYGSMLGICFLVVLASGIG